MKTTVEISDAVFSAAKEAARREGTTLRALIEEGLRLAVEHREGAQRKRFRLRDASVPGKGLHREMTDSSWEKVRSLVYDGHGS